MVRLLLRLMAQSITTISIQTGKKGSLLNLNLMKTQDGSECVKESNDVEEDEGGEDGTAETDFVLKAIHLHLKSSKC